MSYLLAPIADCRAQFFDSQGRVLNGGFLYSYAALSTTPQNTYTDSGGGTANQNPIELDAAGRTPSGVYLTSGISYKFVLKDSSGNTLWTQDVVSGINDTVTPTTQDEWIASGLTPTYVSATSFTLAGDQTTNFHNGRRLKTTNSGGTVYATITNSVFGALTTITTVNDAAASLDSGLSAVSYSMLTVVNPSVDADMVHRKGTAVASATTTNIWGIAGDYVHITGVTTITSLGTAPYAGAERTVIFDGALTLTHDATTLILPGSVNITTAANDRMVVRADTTANMIVTQYTRANATPHGKQPTIQTFTSGSGTYTTPSGATRLWVRIVGGGGGGSGSGTGATVGTAGGNTTFGALTANGGAVDGSFADGANPAGGTASGGNVLNVTGGSGDGTDTNVTRPGGRGGASFYGGGGAGTYFGAAVGNPGGALGSGGGGAGAGGTTSGAGAGGGAGGYVEHVYTAPSATFSYGVGAAGTAGAAGTNGSAGGAGVRGNITVIEYYE